MIHVEYYFGGFHVGLEETLDDISPLDSTKIANIPRTRNIDDAVQCAINSQKEWGSLSIEQRADWLDRIADVLEKNIEDIAKLETLDTGTPNEVARNVD